MADFSIQSFKDDKVIYCYSIAYLVLAILHFLFICFVALGKGPFAELPIEDSFYRFLQESVFILIGVSITILAMVAIRVFIKGAVTPKILIMNGILTAGMVVIIPIIAGVAFTFKLLPDYILFVLPFSAFGYSAYHIGRKIEMDE